MPFESTKSLYGSRLAWLVFLRALIQEYLTTCQFVEASKIIFKALKLFFFMKKKQF